MANEDHKYSRIGLAESVRKACIEAAREGFKDALMSGLCAEGAMEAAVSSIQQLNIENVIQKRMEK
ncbi:acetyltransferase [Fodinibius sp. SL11]|uniref:acetyltransferase n=1 Tax=Fodinibius sp. SL11 TaxID=3425690 RepID=UPI003F880EAD